MAEVVLYLDGVECRLALPQAGSNPEAVAAAAAAQVRAYLAAGFTPTPEATHTAAIDRVVRRQHERDGRKTPVIDMYQSGQNKRFLGVYLNTPDDIQAFEAASGLALNNIPLYDGDAPLQMDAAPPDKLKRYVRFPVKPLHVLWRNNPRYTPDSKTAAKRLLIGYASASETTPANEGQAAELPAALEPAPDAQPAVTSASVSEIRLMKSLAGWQVIVRTEHDTFRAPAEVVGAWSLDEERKTTLRSKRVLDGFGLRAALHDGALVDVAEIDF